MTASLTAKDFLPIDEYKSITKAIDQQTDFHYTTHVRNSYKLSLSSSMASHNTTDNVKENSYTVSFHFEKTKNDCAGHAFLIALEELKETFLTYETALLFIEKNVKQYISTLELLTSSADTSQGEQLYFPSSIPIQSAKSNITAIEQDEELLLSYYRALENVQHNWIDWLESSVNLYKHNSINQVMTFCQSPQSKYVADERTWNKAGRYISFNANYITSMSISSNKVHKAKLYDIASTYGVDVIINNPFALNDTEKKALCDKYHSNSLKSALKSTVSSFVKGNSAKDILVKNSSFYIVARKLGLIERLNSPSKFSLALSIRTEDIKLVTTTTVKVTQSILKGLQSELKEIRSNNYVKNTNDQQSGLSNAAKRNAEERENSNSIQVWQERNQWDTDIRATNRDKGNRQSEDLSNSSIRNNAAEIYAGVPRDENDGLAIGRNADGKDIQPSRGAGRYEASNFGGSRREEPTSSNRQLHGGSSTHGDAVKSSGGNDTRGALSTNIDNEHFNFVISDGGNYGSPKTKYKNNAAAISLLKQIEAEKRTATALEQVVLSKYTGFGGIPKAFDEGADDWENEYAELLELLSPTEYESARASTLTAFYTEPYIIKAMYNGAVKLGINQSSAILDPSMGIGNFFGAMPSELCNAKLHGCEIDSLTGRIAKQLYPNANITINGYQDTRYRDNHFDLCIGNVPFGNFKISDDRHSMIIHDFFFARSLDKVKPNGVVAFITSSGTLDKGNPAFRRYLAERAELIGAVRLPNTAFKAIGNTDVVSDIIFLRKKERPYIDSPDWIYTNITDSGIPINEYFINNPQNILGELVMASSPFGMSSTVKSFNEDTNFSLEQALNNAINAFTSEASENEIKSGEEIKIEDTIPSESTVKNFTFTIHNEKIYYRSDDEMLLQKLSAKDQERIKGIHNIRQYVRKIINLQLEPNYDSDALSKLQAELTKHYDEYINKYDYFNSAQNRKVFKNDSDSPLILSLEIKNKDGTYSKSKMFSCATITPKQKFVPASYDDLITLTMTDKGKIDIRFMAESFDVSPVDVLTNLKGKIYIDPEKVSPSAHAALHEYIEYAVIKQELDLTEDDILKYAYEELIRQNQDCFVTSDEYLSGNVKQKLDIAAAQCELYPAIYSLNVSALKEVQPLPLTIDQIDYKLGSSWIDIKYYRQFIFELSEVAQWNMDLVGNSHRNRISLQFDKLSNQYTIFNKSLETGVNITSTYGTNRKSFFHIVEDSLNLRDCKVYDYVEKDGQQKAVLNVSETKLARQKQALIKQEFKSWLVSSPERVVDIVKTYNDKFNVYRTREYDGSHLTFAGKNSDINLRPHQKNAVARILYSGSNTLLGHVVGAGKTYTMIAAAMELKRVGLANKPLFVVPNHLTGQWGNDFIKLFPGANILVATKKDFEPANRKRFTGKMTTGSYDAVIIGHTQFEKIPISDEQKKKEIKEQLDEIIDTLSKTNREDTPNYTIKQLEKKKAQLKETLNSLDKKPKDNVVTFEETGVDFIFIDEAHYYKNCYVNTKLSNVSGVTTSNAQKSFDMLLKTKYITEKNNGNGVIFATGTPISNSMTEMFVLQRYLQADALSRSDLLYFDNWASTFGETKTVLEIKPEGTGFRAKTRFSNFCNLPELMSMFSLVADIKVAEDLKLPTPKMVSGKPIIELCEPSDYVKEFIASLAPRAEKIRNGNVKPWQDNMLKVTNEGRCIALDARVLDPNAPVDYNSKIYRCCDNVHKLYTDYSSESACQLVFCDLSTPTAKISRTKENAVDRIDKNIFTDVYNEIKTVLIDKGIKASEIAFIHDAKTDQQKDNLFEKCRNGEIRVLLGSTNKMGAGTNVQERLIAVHHLDCPWRPADIEQRDGRILRNGNMFNDVYVYRYVTKDTFDTYLWQIQENKQKFITQIMTNKSSARTCEDIDESVLDCAEVKALATGNPKIKIKVDLDNEVSLLQLERSAHLKQVQQLQNMIVDLPSKIDGCEARIERLKNNISIYKKERKDTFSIIVNGTFFDDRTKAGAALSAALKNTNQERFLIGEYCGLPIYADRLLLMRVLYLGESKDSLVELGNSELGNITRLENAGSNLDHLLSQAEESLIYNQKQLAKAKSEVKKPFAKEDELKEKQQKLFNLNMELELNQKDNQIAEEGDNAPSNNQTENTQGDFDNEI